MNLGRSFIWGVGSSVWSAIVTFATLPLLIGMLGLEAYGVIGFFLTLQTLLQLLDLGMTPTISRQVARAGATGEERETRNLLHSLAIIYWVVGALLALLLFLATGFIANQWLNSSTLARDDLERGLALMGLALAARWPSALYTGALTGAGRLPTVGAISMVTAATANIGVLAVLTLVAPTLETFFLWQAAVNLAQSLALRSAIWRHLRRDEPTRFDPPELIKIWRFSAGMTGITLAGLALSQLDKILLSWLVPLSEFANYVLAGVVAGLLFLVGRPMFQTVYPRLSALVASGDEAALARTYHLATRLLASLALPMAMAMTVYGHDLLLLWLSSEEIARRAAPSLALLAAGTALNAIMHMPFALQIAYGRVRLALAISVSLAILIVPLIVVLAMAYGAVGAAAAWLILHLIYLVGGTWLTHRAILVGDGWRWFLQGFAAPMGITLLFGLVALGIDRQFAPHPLLNLAIGGGIVALSIAACLLTSGELRKAGVASMLAFSRSPS